jgi:hypothetical protein
MKNLKSIGDFINEWIDSPGSVDVPGQDSEVKVNSRNYTPAHQPLPYIEDSMFEANEVYDFLDDHGNSENFNKFVGEKRSGREITDHIKQALKENKFKKS